MVAYNKKYLDLKQNKLIRENLLSTSVQSLPPTKYCHHLRQHPQETLVRGSGSYECRNSETRRYLVEAPVFGDNTGANRAHMQDVQVLAPDLHVWCRIHLQWTRANTCWAHEPPSTPPLNRLCLSVKISVTWSPISITLPPAYGSPQFHISSKWSDNLLGHDIKLRVFKQKIVKLEQLINW